MGLLSDFKEIVPQKGENPEKIEAANKRRVGDLHELFTAEQEKALEEQLREDSELREKLRAMIEKVDEEERDGAN